MQKNSLVHLCMKVGSMLIAALCDHHCEQLACRS